MRSIFITAISQILCVLLVATSSLQAQTHPDIAPLTAIYNATGGPNWTNKTNWLSDNNPCGWYGIACNSNRVTKIDLRENNVIGVLPIEIGNLTNLQTLWLSTNQLSGSIPSQIGNLSNLLSLALDNNNLSGSIPTQLGKLNKLERLVLGNNQLTGKIPTGLGNLTNLKSLILQFNQLSGTIPLQLGNLSNVESLWLNHNQLTGSIPSELSYLTTVKTFFLDNNKLSGEIPIQLGNLKSVQFLNLHDNQLTGNIPTQLGSLSTLITLQLHNNQLSGSIPSQLSNLLQLQSLLLKYNNLSGCIPASFSALCNRNVHVELNGNAGLPSGGSEEAWSAFCATGAGSSFTAVASTSTPTVCVGTTISLSVTGGTSYAWGGPNGFTSSAKNPSFTATSIAQGGMYTVTANNGGGACSATATVSVSIKAYPAITTQSNSPVCAGFPVNLSAITNDTKLTYQWSKDGGGFSSTVKNPIIANATTANAGAYILVVTGSNGCTISSSVSVIVNATPTVSVSPSGSVFICGSSPVQLTANATAGVSFQWFRGTTAVGTGATYDATQTGTYKCEVAINGNCKVASNSTTITFNSVPNAVASNAVTAKSLSLSVTPNSMLYKWAGPNGFSTTVQKPKIANPTVVNSGIYSVTVSSTSSCTASATTNVIISNSARMVTEEDTELDDIHLIVSPNPTTGKSVVEVSLNQAAQIHLTMSDGMGKSLNSWESDGVVKRMVVEIDLTHHRPGLYLILAETNQGRTTKKLWKQ
ncbi:MAG: T9SS type A sorting domain-containing protein [Spirosomataceae bacterium]